MEVSAVPSSDYLFKTNEAKPYMDDVFEELLKQVNLMLMKDDVETTVEEIEDENGHQEDILFYGFSPGIPGMYQNVIIVDDTASKTETQIILPANMADGEKIISEAVEETAALNDDEIQTVGGNIMAEENTKSTIGDSDKAATVNKKINTETLSKGNVKKEIKIPKLAESRLEASVSQQEDLVVKTLTVSGSELKSNAVSELNNKPPDEVASSQDNKPTNSKLTDKVTDIEDAIKDIPSMRINNISLTDNKEYLSRENINTMKVEIVESINLIIEGKESVIEIELNPRELGKVHISLKLEEGKLSAKFLVKNENIKDILINSIDVLNKSLKSQNIYIAKMDINVASDLNSNFGGQPNREHDTGKDNSRWKGINETEKQIQKTFDFKREGVSILA